MSSSNESLSIDQVNAYLFGRYPDDSHDDSDDVLSLFSRTSHDDTEFLDHFVPLLHISIVRKIWKEFLNSGCCLFFRDEFVERLNTSYGSYASRVCRWEIDMAGGGEHWWKYVVTWDGNDDNDVEVFVMNKDGTSKQKGTLVGVPINDEETFLIVDDLHEFSRQCELYGVEDWFQVDNDTMKYLRYDN